MDSVNLVQIQAETISIHFTRNNKPREKGTNPSLLLKALGKIREKTELLVGNQSRRRTTSNRLGVRLETPIRKTYLLRKAQIYYLEWYCCHPMLREELAGWLMKKKKKKKKVSTK